MASDKEIKKKLKIEASHNPDKYYATKVLKDKGFIRKQCQCGINFWTVNKDQEHCGDSACAGGFRFFTENPAKSTLSYIEVWEKFSEMFRNLGYTPIKRYPVVARWNATMDFTIASIAAFQPYVISGEVEPPAEKLVIPQFCLRFPDIDNVGITGSHMTGFIMIGQHMFVPADKWNQDQAFSDILKWLTKGLSLPLSEITFHEDAWAGGGNSGPCMEFFSRGVEIGNQVYMMYEQKNGERKELKLKVLDMGMGHERNAWFSQGTNTIYEATFPEVIKNLLSKTGISYDDEFMKKYAPYAGILNLDEVDDIDKAWQIVADKVGTDVKTLKEKIEPMTGIFSIAEHARSLLFALNDGALPSNVGGGYNLRVLIRRALSFIDKFRWDIQLAEVCRWHAESLKPLFPELMENLKEIEKILEVERSKYEATKQKIETIVSRLLEKDVMIDEDKLIELYDSEGINPGLIAEEAKKLGKKIEIPDNFFGKVAERHEKKEQEHATIKEDNLDLKEIEETEAMYYKDYDTTEFTAKVLKIIEKNIILDKTLFYPTSGGQMHDKGTINGLEVVDVFKQGAVIVHVIKEDALFKEGEEIEGILDFDRRKQLAQHHSAAHIVNAAAKRVLGNHINQAGAKKTEEKAHLDITHYQSITQDEQQAIEDQTNKIVEEKLPIYKTFMPRRKAEDKYGMRLYQGGAVPGKEIRVVEIPEVDVEACGGTHLNNTSEVGTIRIIKTTKVQDGIVRIVFTAGKATENLSSQEGEVLDKVAKLLNCDADQVPARVEELFSLWKKIVKKKKDIEFMLESKERFEGDALVKSCEMLKTQPEHLINTIKRFLKEIEEVEAKKWK